MSGAPEPLPDAYAVACTVQGDRRYRNGAKLTLVTHTGGGERAEFWGKSLGGRDIRKWVDLRKVSNVRVIWASPAMRKHGFSYSCPLAADKAARTLRLCQQREAARTPRRTA